MLAFAHLKIPYKAPERTSGSMCAHAEVFIEELGVDLRDITTLYVWRHHAGLLMAISSPSAHIVFTIPTFLDALLGRLEASSLHACARWLVLHLQWSSICIASWLHNKNEKSSRNNNEKSSSNNEIQEFQIYQRKRVRDYKLHILKTHETGPRSGKLPFPCFIPYLLLSLLIDL